MLNGVTFSDFNNDYQIPDIFGNSSRSELPYDLDSIERLIHLVNKKKKFRKNFDLWAMLPVITDISTVKPLFEINNETYHTDIYSEEDILDAMIENDYIIKMPPKNKYPISIKIRKIKKAKPRIVKQ